MQPPTTDRLTNFSRLAQPTECELYSSQARRFILGAVAVLAHYPTGRGDPSFSACLMDPTGLIIEQLQRDSPSAARGEVTTLLSRADLHWRIGNIGLSEIFEEAGLFGRLDLDALEPALGRGLRVLFLENHETFARTVTEAFMHDHQVTIVSSVEQALGAYSPEGADIVLADYDLDIEKGDAFVHNLRRRGDTVPILAVSAREFGNEQLIAAGANRACPKADFSAIGEVLESSFDLALRSKPPALR